MRPKAIREFAAGQAAVEVFGDRAQAGSAAAWDVAKSIHQYQAESHETRVVFAAAPSQNEFLDGLAASKEIDWSRITAFHMDEYLGIPATSPASFRYYLREHILDRVAIDPAKRFLIPGEATDRPLSVCLEYEDLLRAKPVNVVCAGIGENGHLAFNDPPVADFLDPLWLKIVRLDEECRIQQVHDGCFSKLDDVPTHAFTMTISALLSAQVLSVVVPGPRKAKAVRDALLGPISEKCPASVLRRHTGARIYLDRDSAANLP